ncbi:hypothetical protein JB92DRAFT_2982481 [Gautieria morchelliformis]|nr:hypothetical protein JB92DRAFT_2982481 [Gautieria morchelliformis]
MSAILHQSLFTVIALTAIAELSLTAFLLSKGNDSQTFESQKFHDLLIYTLVVSVWTIFFGIMYAYWIISQALHFLASVATSLWWLCLTSLLWGIAAGLIHSTRTGGICDGLPPISRCRQSLTVEGLGWAEFSLCLFTVFATWIWVSAAEDAGSWRGSWYTGSPQVRTEPMRQA